MQHESEASTEAASGRDPAWLQSDAGNFARVTPLSYAYADIALSLVWNAALVRLAPSWTVFLPAAVTGIAAILVDYVWFYRSGRRLLRVDGAEPDGRFVAWWLVLWFDFLIAWNIGSFVGLVLQVGLGTKAGMGATAAFLLWFWIATPILSRALNDAGIGREVVATTRLVGASLSFKRAIWVAALYALLVLGGLVTVTGRLGELFVIGCLAAGAMEVPLYMLRIRPGREAWKALVLNTLVEWNYAVPIFYIVFREMGRAY